MYSVRSVLGVRRFCSVGRISSVRKFSLIENSSAKSGEKFLPIYKNGERINIEVTQSKIQKDYYPKKMNTKLGSELWFTKDRAFIKYLSSIHLRSKDREAISSARLLAYFITQKVKPRDVDVVNGIARALSHIMGFMKQNARKIHEDHNLVLKAGTVYGKGNNDIAQIIDFVNFGDTRRTLLVTKDVSGTSNESFLEVQNSLALDVGHSSYHFINDKLNYRYDVSQPIIILAENLDEDLASNVLHQLEDLSNGVVFVANQVDKSAKNLLLSQKDESGIAVSLIDLSEESSEGSGSFEIIKNNLKDFGDASPKTGYYLKSWDRVLMDSSSSFFVDAKFDQSGEEFQSENFQELVEVNLKNPDETWCHEVRNNVLEANTNLEDSLIEGILPGFNTTLKLANEDLKEFYSDDKNIQTGLEIVQESIDSYIKAIKEDKEDSLLSIDGALEKAISEGTFVPERKAAKVISDIWSICSYLLSQKRN